VTGEAHVTYQGVVYPVRPIELVNPVPAEIFERNQQLMAAVKGRQRQNPLGHFLLNRIEFLHDACQHHVTDDGLQVRLRGRDKIYTHDKRCPLPECKRFTLPHKEVDAAIVAELLRLCEDPELQRRYQQRARADTTNPPAGVLTPSQQRSHEARITDLGRQREQIQRDWLQGANSQDLNPRYLQESLELIDAEITRLERQLDLSKRLRAAQHNPRPDDRAQLLDRAREILTPEPPDDPELRQRRLIFVQQALSKVVARRTTTGFELELYGPLIPADAAPLHFDPLEHGRPCLQARTDLEGHARKSVPRWRGACGPAWRSEAIGIRWSRRAGPASRARLGSASREDVRAAIRVASDAGGPGPIRAVLERHLTGREELPSARRIVRYLASEGVSLDEETRAVIGVERALRLRRVLPASVADWELLIGMAIDEGLSFERGWSARWDQLHARVGWLGSHHRMTDAQRRLGFSLVAIAAAELERRGLPARQITHQPGRGRDTSLEACLDGLREAARHASPGRLSRPKIQSVLDGQDVLPTQDQISSVLSQRGIAKETAVRMALGQREALVSGRVVPRTRAEWITVMSAAIDDGYTGERGWLVGWDALCQRHPRYVRSRTVWRAVKRYGGLRALYAAASHERDARDQP